MKRKCGHSELNDDQRGACGRSVVCTRGLDPVVGDWCTIAKLESLRNEGAGRGGGSGSSEAGGATRSFSLPSCGPAASL